jgi:phosphatidylinositol alpha-mannosyltransferase
MSRTFERVITPYTKSVLKFLHELTAVSDIAAEYVQFLAHTKPAIIPNGVDLAQYSSKPRITTNKLKTVLYIGRLERRKGLKYLLKAFALLSTNDKSTQLIVAGEGPDRPKLAQYVQDNRIPRVHFKGFVSEQEKLDLLKNADLFCSPALFGESFGIVLLEAMARGCVIVAGDNVGYKSVLKETGRLSIVNPKHSQEFASRLELLLTDEALRKAWFDWANTYVRQFAFERITDQYETIYKAAIKQLQ